MKLRTLKIIRSILIVLSLAGFIIAIETIKKTGDVEYYFITLYIAFALVALVSEISFIEKRITN